MKTEHQIIRKYIQKLLCEKCLPEQTVLLQNKNLLPEANTQLPPPQNTNHDGKRGKK